MTPLTVTEALLAKHACKVFDKYQMKGCEQKKIFLTCVDFVLANYQFMIQNMGGLREENEQ